MPRCPEHPTGRSFIVIRLSTPLESKNSSFRSLFLLGHQLRSCLCSGFHRRTGHDPLVLNQEPVLLRNAHIAFVQQQDAQIGHEATRGTGLL